MATAKRNTKVIQVEQEVDDGLTLTLSQREAETLADVLAVIAGPESGPRGDTQAILEALKANGVNWSQDRSFPVNNYRDEYNHISMHEYRHPGKVR